MGLTFKGINEAQYAGAELTDILQTTLKWWLDWGFAHEGAYEIVVKDDDEALTRISQDERFQPGQVWDGFGRQWIWESGIQGPSGGINPTRVSGIYIDDVFFPIGTSGTFAFHVDYIHARIIFDNSQANNIEVKVPSTVRQIMVADSDSPVFRELMLNANADFLDGSQTTSTPSKDFQVHMPSIFIRIDTGRQRGLQLGGGQIKTRIVSFHIFTETPQDRNLLMDWIDYQSRIAFNLVDINKIPPQFDEFGDILPNTTNWIDLQEEFPYKKMRVNQATSATLDSLNPNIFRGRVQYEIEVDFGTI